MTSGSRFQPTRWSLVARATQDNAPAARAALDELCRIYWQPLCSFAQRWGLSTADAEDATQTFFAELLRTENFALGDPHRGHLRTFLLHTFTRRLIDFRRREQAASRGGGTPVLPLEAESGAPDPRTPEREFNRQWAEVTMSAALTHLESEYARGSSAEFLAASRPLLGLEASGNDDYAAVASRLGMKEGAVRVAVCRLRQRFREILFRTVAETLEEPGEANVRAEIGALIEALSA